PAGASINTTNGIFSWTPTEAQGPGTNDFTVIVTDNGVPPLSATQSVEVIVLESNRPPTLAPIADRTLHAGMTLIITNTATDPDLPANTLTFSLDPGAPPGAGLGSSNGVFVWTPGDSDAN